MGKSRRGTFTKEDSSDRRLRAFLDLEEDKENRSLLKRAIRCDWIHDPTDVLDNDRVKSTDPAMGMEADKEYSFRPYKESDLNFIMSSWGHSYYKGYTYQFMLSPKDFHLFHRPIRENIMKRPTVATIVCVAKIDPDLIIGWVAVEKPVDYAGIIIHYLYVKEAFKGRGIASELYKSICPSVGPVFHSHITERADRIIQGHERFKRCAYVPHCI